MSSRCAKLIVGAGGGAVVAGSPSGEDGQVDLDRIVELAHRHLGVDVVLVAELASDRQVCRAIAGDGASFQIALNDVVSAHNTYAREMVAGEIPNVIRATAVVADGIKDLSLMQPAGVGSFIGVPLSLSDGCPYGALCCFNHAADQSLDERDLRFMSMLADLMVADLDKRAVQQRLSEQLIGLIDADAVGVAYQPIFDLAQNRCLGVEALARFPAPFTKPEETFAAAERLGIGLALEELVVRRAWRVISQLGQGQFLALNLTPSSFIALAERAKRRDDLPLSSLVIEITEHTAVEAYSDLRTEFQRLRERGVRIAVDDAGAGYASLRHVLELRPDIVKIDRSLIHGLAGDHARQTTVGAFVSLAANFGSTVVAEGVEERSDYDAARELGLHAAQGFLLGPPTTDCTLALSGRDTAQRTPRPSLSEK